jgi:hypothetical protein
MKTILDSRKRYYMRSVSIFLIVVALVAAMVSCNGGVTEYNLTMAEAPVGTGTATDETGTSPYAEGTDVDIKAVAAPCYRFVDWSAPAGEIGNTTAAETTFTMPARDVTVTANFEPVPPDHFKFYTVDWEEGLYVGMDVQLVDQFGTFNATVGDPVSFGNPVQKIHNDDVTPIADENRHYTLYSLDYGEEESMLDSWQVVVNNQFQDDEELTVVGPYYLAVPTTKEGHEEPVCLNHFLVYQVVEKDFPEVGVQLKDQFIEEDVVVWEPVYFANPVQKTIVDSGEVTEIEKDDEHLVFYSIEDIGFNESINKSIQIANQFGPQTLNLTYPEFLAVPSQKISWEQPLDHFHCYWATWADEPPPTFPAEVQLEDQFITEWLGEPLIATVGAPALFANPVNKYHGEVWTPISNWNDHYTFYELDYEEITPVWYVKVSNQFDPVEPGYQELYVKGPDMLAVPTKKGLQDPPVGLDHFLVYTVVGEPPVLDEDIWLWDQFTEQGATVYPAAYFANPVKKTIVESGDVTDIKHPDDHLVLYWIDGGEFFEEWLPIDNQFGPQVLMVGQDEYDFIGVPSQKIDFSIAD